MRTFALPLLLALTGCGLGHSLQIGVGRDFNDFDRARGTSSFSNGSSFSKGDHTRGDAHADGFHSFEGSDFGDTTSLWAVWEIQLTPQRQRIENLDEILALSRTEGEHLQPPREREAPEGEQTAPETEQDHEEDAPADGVVTVDIEKGTFSIGAADWVAYLGIAAVLLALGWVVYAWKAGRPVRPWKKKGEALHVLPDGE